MSNGTKDSQRTPSVTFDCPHAHIECSTCEESKAAREMRALRACLREILTNCEGVLNGGLPHFSKRDIASAVADRARAALEGRYR